MLNITNFSTLIAAYFNYHMQNYFVATACIPFKPQTTALQSLYTANSGLRVMFHCCERVMEGTLLWLDCYLCFIAALSEIEALYCWLGRQKRGVNSAEHTYYFKVLNCPPGCKPTCPLKRVGLSTDRS